MKPIQILFFSFALLPITAQAQEDDIYRICTEIILDPVEYEQSDLPPGMVAKAVAFKPELGKYWPNGRSLRVGFIGGSESVRSRVRKYASEWSEVANIRFIFVEKGETDLRVGFNNNLGTWSLIGTDASHMSQYKPTINFGWFNKPMAEADYRATILHEFGHALGLLHEHQHPLGGIPWDKSKLYPFYQRTQGWDQAMVDQQVLGHYTSGKTQYSRYDPYSIMHYPIPNSLTVGDFEVGMNMNLSSTDRAFMAKVYPKKIPATTTPSSRPVATTGTTRPTTTKPVTVPVTLTIRNALATDQKREQVWITVDGVTRTFVLDQSTNQAGKITFNLPKNGRYPYEIRTKTTYVRRVNGRLQETVLNGHGEGDLSLSKNALFDLTMGKSYNERWFQVLLTPPAATK